MAKAKKPKKIDNTAKKEPKKRKGRADHLIAAGHGFKKGISGNPNGRPKGSRNKFGEEFIKDFLDVWTEGGKDALLRVRKDDPSTFIKVAASILPKQLDVNLDSSELEKLLEQFSITELDQLITGIAAIGATQRDVPPKAPKAVGSKPDSVH